MGRYITVWLAACIPLILLGQERSLPADLRTHNLTQINASLLNPIFSLTENEQGSLSVWTRWQWQTFDGDPTTLFINYSQLFGERTAAGLGFFQNNTGVFLNTGATLNAACSFTVGETTDLVIGTNLFAFNQELADENFGFQPSDSTVIARENAFLLRLSPGIQLKANTFSIGVVVDNVLKLDLSDAESDDTPTVFTGMIGNDFPITFFEKESHFKPMAYIRAIQNADAQFGVVAFFEHPMFWVQSGYNSFYGFSGGVGVTLVEQFRLGALLETGLDTPASNEDATLELLISYVFGGQKSTKKKNEEQGVAVEEEIPPAPEVEPKPEEEARENQRIERERALANARQDSISRAKEAARLQRESELAKARQDSINRVREVELAKDNEAARLQRESELAKARQDSINRVREVELTKAQEAARLERESELAKARQDSINRVREVELANAKEAARLERERALTKAREDSINNAQEVELAKVKEAARLERENALAKARQDSINSLKKAARLDSLKTVEQEKDVAIQPGEKYEEVATEDGLAPGFYLIANVFGTKKYFENFIKTLQTKGLEPKSFYRKLNGYNYVYLERYDSISEARKARDSKFNGRYLDKLWIFRVKGK